jgi:hypothetical protein
MMVDHIPINFRDGCFGSCILAEVCKQRVLGTTRELGDRATELFGHVPIERVAELIAGAAPETATEREMAPRLREARRVLPRTA